MSSTIGSSEKREAGGLVWRGDPKVTGGVRERGFEIDVSGRPVPGVLWTPSAYGGDADARGPRPLVLIGHGATRDKRVDYVVALARRFVRDFGLAAAAIDGPGHGDRRIGDPTDDITLFAEFLTEWARPTSTDEMVEDWTFTIAALRSLDEIDEGPMAYWGLSMGTIYGIPLVAADDRFKVAVLGLMGMVGPTEERLKADAAAITCPVLFIQQWDDALIPRSDAFALFDGIGSSDKRLHANPGPHAGVPPDEFAASADFVARHLR